MVASLPRTFFAPGPTAHAATRIYAGHEISAFRIFVNEAMIHHICKCTTAEDQRINGDDWRIEPAEMDKFIGLIIARGVSGECNLLLRSMWSP